MKSVVRRIRRASGPLAACRDRRRNSVIGTAALHKSSLDRVVYSSSSFRQPPCSFTIRHRVAGDKTGSGFKNSTTFVLLRTGQRLKRQPRCCRLSVPATVIRFSRPDRLIAPPDPRAYRPLAIELPQNGLVFRVFQPVVVLAAVNASLFWGLVIWQVIA
jgi:hypothetical protein